MTNPFYARPKPVDAARLTNLKMTAGGEAKLKRVVQGGILKEWVGIGWIEVRAATRSDRKRYPEVKEMP